MIFTQEAPLTRKWFSGRSCIRSNWNKLGVNFEEGGNPSARRKPSKSGWDRLKLNPHTAFVVEVEGVIDVHYASLTSQGVQHWVFYSDGHPSRYQPRPTGLNFCEQTGTGVFPSATAIHTINTHYKSKDKIFPSTLTVKARTLTKYQMQGSFIKIAQISIIQISIWCTFSTH